MLDWPNWQRTNLLSFFFFLSNIFIAFVRPNFSLFWRWIEDPQGPRSTIALIVLGYYHYNYYNYYCFCCFVIYLLLFCFFCLIIVQQCIAISYFYFHYFRFAVTLFSTISLGFRIIKQKLALYDWVDQFVTMASLNPMGLCVYTIRIVCEISKL